MAEASPKEYEVAIVGAGVTGTALLFSLARYTSVRKIVLLEKYGDAAEVNSHSNNNSQTLHFGDIETNYSLEKAARVKESAEMLARYLEKLAPQAFRKEQKMVLAVGEAEVAELRRRYEEFKTLFPNLKKAERDEIARLEPTVVEGRDPKEPILALTTGGYTVNYKKLSLSYVAEAEKSGKEIEVRYNAPVGTIREKDGGFEVETPGGVIRAKTVAVMAGPHSLLFARDMGYGGEFGLLPVAGSFYRGERLLNGKVYTMQLKKLPFAAIHGDPDVENPHETRFGPTAKVLPMLERHNWSTIPDFLQASVWSIRGVLSLLAIISDATIFRYVLKNVVFDLPIVGRWAFVREARKIIPTLKYGDIAYGKGLGGIRPQIVDTRTKKLNLGEAEIVGDRILFNITPSPGASVSLKNAEQDTRKIVGFLGPDYRFEAERWCEDFGSTLAECRE